VTLLVPEASHRRAGSFGPPSDMLGQSSGSTLDLRFERPLKGAGARVPFRILIPAMAVLWIWGGSVLSPSGGPIRVAQGLFLGDKPKNMGKVP